jgi:hypothetical protein
VFVRECEFIHVLVANVDDFELSGPNGSPALDAAETYLQEHFELKRVPDDSELLGISIVRGVPTRSAHLNQQRCTMEVLQRFRHADAAPVSHTLSRASSSSSTQQATESAPVSQTQMRSAQCCTLPGASAQTWRKRSAHCHTTCQHRGRATGTGKWLPRYFRSTRTHGLCYGGDAADAKQQGSCPSS